MKYIITENQYKIIVEQTTSNSGVKEPEIIRDIKKLATENPICISFWGKYFESAKKWWIDWLSNPITKQKFKTNWKVGADNKIDGILVDDLFKKYIDTINKLKIVHLSNYPEDPQMVAMVIPKYTKDTVFVNCKLDATTKPTEALIHEIQHILYSIKPLNPEKQIGDAFINNNTKILTPQEIINQTLGLQPYDTVFNQIPKKYGVTYQIYKTWNERVDLNSESDPNYVCKQSEKMSNIVAMRKLFKINPGQNITFEMLKPYINLEKKNINVSWFLMCWAKQGYKDIDTMLKDINLLAFQDTQNNNTEIV